MSKFCPNCGNIIDDDGRCDYCDIGNQKKKKSRKKKVTAVAASLVSAVLVCTAVVFGYYKLLGFEKPSAGGSAETADIQTENPERDEVPVITEPPVTVGENTPVNNVLTPEKAVGIYLDNRSVWFDETVDEDSAYCFLDLDFDGNLEMIVDSGADSTANGENRYYRINTVATGVEEINKPDGSYDHVYSYPGKLLKNKATKKMMYCFEDITKMDEEGCDILWGSLFVEDGTLKTKRISSKHYNESSDGEDRCEYYKKGETLSIDKAEYDTFVSLFLTAYIDMELEWGYVKASDLEDVSEDEEKALLTAAYSEFKYDGFSFD